MQEFRQVRVLVYPGRRSTAWAVVARSVSRNGSTDRIIARGMLDDPERYESVGALLLAVSDLCADAAKRVQ